MGVVLSSHRAVQTRGSLTHSLNLKPFHVILGWESVFNDRFYGQLTEDQPC